MPGTIVEGDGARSVAANQNAAKEPHSRLDALCKPHPILLLRFCAL